MWMVDPRLLCVLHLNGEHRETHSLVGMINKKMSMSGTKYITTGLVEVHSIRRRHDDLASEMSRRGYNHKSPLAEFVPWHEGCVNSEKNLIELRTRCLNCRKIQEESGIISNANV